MQDVFSRGRVRHARLVWQGTGVHKRPPASELRRIYAETETIAVVGASPDETKPAYRIPRYMQSQGYRIIPVNPEHDEILGERSHPSLADIEEPIDLVSVFRPAAEAPAIARDAVSAGAKVLWLQEGVSNDEADRIATEAGLAVVMDRCIGVMHGALGLGPGPGH